MASLSGAHSLPLLPLTLYSTHIVLYCVMECCIILCLYLYKERGQEDCTILQQTVLRHIRYILCYMHILQPTANRLTTFTCLRPDVGHGPFFHKFEEVGPSFP